MCDASIIVLTCNGEKHLPQVLEMIYRQNSLATEVLAIDSGSTDSTLKILQGTPSQIHQIAKEDFGHSKTRNLAARLSKGKYAVFLTQDATPADSCWLERLLQPFQDYPGIAGVFSRHVPRPGTDLLEANDLHVYFKTVRQIKTLPADQQHFRNHIWDYIQFSNASSAYDRRLLLENPFDESLPMVEDQEWSKRMLEKGYSIVYEPESVVLHSHEHTLAQKYRRNRQIGLGFSQFLSAELGKRPFPWRPWFYNMMTDAVFIVNAEAPPLTKMKWLCLSPFHRAAMHYAIYEGWNSKIRNA